MAGTKPDLDSLYRLLRLHSWTNVEDWAEAIDTLADLTDQQIERIADNGRCGSGTGRSRGGLD